jgi:ferredoxin
MVAALEARGADWKMLYGGRRRKSMAYLDVLGRYSDKLEICPEEEFGLLDLASTVGNSEQQRAIYCCGPGPLIDAVIQTCSTLGHEAPYFERFSGEVVEYDTSADFAFDVLIDGTDLRLEVPVDKSIATVLEENGIWVPTSCTEGYCGVCETRVIAGIPDHRDEYLTEETRATNRTMMICIGRSKTPELVLRIGN